MIEVNLLPADLREKARPASPSLPFKVPRVVPLVAGGVILLMIAMYVVSSSKGSSLAARLHELRTRLKKQESLEKRAKAATAELPTLQKKAKALDDMVGQRVAYWRVLEQVALATPGTVQVKRMKVEPRPNVANAKRFVIEAFYSGGFSLEQELLNNLRGNAVLSEAIGNIIVAERNPEGEIVTFIVFCDFREGP